jgi:hypothetical protein
MAAVATALINIFKHRCMAYLTVLLMQTLIGIPAALLETA